VTDSAGNTYHVAVPTFRGGGLSQAIYYATNILSGANTVTVMFDIPAKYVDLRVTEYSGLSQDHPFDAGASASGTGALADSGPVTTSQANELLFAAGMTGSSFNGAADGWALEVITSRTRILSRTWRPRQGPTTHRPRWLRRVVDADGRV
jgi:hypothetical protein